MFFCAKKLRTKKKQDFFAKFRNRMVVFKFATKSWSKGFSENLTLDQLFVANYFFFAKFGSLLLALTSSFTFLVRFKEQISTSVRSAQHPNAG